MSTRRASSSPTRLKRSWACSPPISAPSTSPSPTPVACEMKLKQVAEDQGATPEAVQQMTVGIAQIFAQQITPERPELEGRGQGDRRLPLGAEGQTWCLKITPKASLPLITVVQAANNDLMSLLDEVNIEATVSRRSGSRPNIFEACCCTRDRRVKRATSRRELQRASKDAHADRLHFSGRSRMCSSRSCLGLASPGRAHPAGPAPAGSSGKIEISRRFVVPHSSIACRWADDAGAGHAAMRRLAGLVGAVRAAEVGPLLPVRL